MNTPVIDKKAFYNVNTISVNLGVKVWILQRAKDHEFAGKIIARRSRSGASMYVSCFIHWNNNGDDMLRAYASGHGYQVDLLDTCMREIFNDHVDEFNAHGITWDDATANLGGCCWRNLLDDAGYIRIRVI